MLIKDNLHNIARSDRIGFKTKNPNKCQSVTTHLGDLQGSKKVVWKSAQNALEGNN